MTHALPPALQLPALTRRARYIAAAHFTIKNQRRGPSAHGSRPQCWPAHQVKIASRNCSCSFPLDWATRSDRHTSFGSKKIFSQDTKTSDHKTDAPRLQSTLAMACCIVASLQRPGAGVHRRTNLSPSATSPHSLGIPGSHSRAQGGRLLPLMAEALAEQVCYLCSPACASRAPTPLQRCC